MKSGRSAAESGVEQRWRAYFHDSRLRVKRGVTSYRRLFVAKPKGAARGGRALGEKGKGIGQEDTKAFPGEAKRAAHMSRMAATDTATASENAKT